MRQRRDIVYPGEELKHQAPAGFGAIASFWTPRREYAGTYDRAWEKLRKPLLPEDYDVRFSLCAPADQQPGEYLIGGEQIELFHLTPERHTRLSIPKVTLRLATFFGRKVQEHPAQLATVVLETAERRLFCVWQSALAVPAAQVPYLDVTRIDEQGMASS